MLVLCNGMVRSGSTLQFNLCRQILLRSGNADAVTELGYVESIGGLDADRITEMAGSSSVYLLKTHSAAQGRVAEAVNLPGVYSLYCFRDPRDAIVSIQSGFGHSFDEAQRILADAQHAHTEITRRTQVLTQRYEELLAHCLTAAHEIASFLSVDVSDKTLAEVAEDCDITGRDPFGEELTAAERFMVWLRKQKFAKVLARTPAVGSLGRYIIRAAGLHYDKETLLHPGHISRHRGASGVWRDVLAPHEVSQIQLRFGSFIKELGYGD